MTRPSRLCPQGHPNPPGQMYCGQCGSPLTGLCPNGHTVPEGQKFCGQCGSAVTAPSQEGGSRPVHSSPRTSAPVPPSPPYNPPRATGSLPPPSSPPYNHPALQGSAYDGGPTNEVQGRWAKLPTWGKVAAVGVPLVLLPVLAASVFGGNQPTGPSESYLWGVKAGNSALPSVNGGAKPKLACKNAFIEGSMYADDPVLNQTPPPTNFDYGDAEQGCLDQIRKRLGYLPPS